MKPVDVESNTYIDSFKKLILKILNLELVILLEYEDIKIFLPKVTLQVGLKKFLWLKKLKILCHGHMLLIILTEKKLLDLFMKKNCKRVIKRKGDKLVLNGKNKVIHLIAGQIKKT